MQRPTSYLRGQCSAIPAEPGCLSPPHTLSSFLTQRVNHKSLLFSSLTGPTFRAGKVFSSLILWKVISVYQLTLSLTEPSCIKIRRHSGGWRQSVNETGKNQGAMVPKKNQLSAHWLTWNSQAIRSSGPEARLSPFKHWLGDLTSVPVLLPTVDNTRTYPTGRGEDPWVSTPEAPRRVSGSVCYYCHLSCPEWPMLCLWPPCQSADTTLLCSWQLSLEGQTSSYGNFPFLVNKRMSHPGHVGPVY